MAPPPGEPGVAVHPAILPGADLRPRSSPMLPFEYLEPRSVADAVRQLALYEGRARVLAGGTDLLLQMQAGRHAPAALIYAGRIPELRGIGWSSDEGLRIGAGTTLREVENDPTVRERYPALARAASEVGSVQIRNLATLAGNVVNASPSADTSPALLLHDAVVELVGAGGVSRSVPLGEFWTGPGTTALQAGELVTAIVLPPPPEGLRTFYRKLAVRKAMDLAMVGVAAGVVRSNGAITHARVALGAVAPVCLRAREAEQALLQEGPAAAARAAQLAVAATSPIDDQRASASYRRAMAQRLTGLALAQLLT